MARFTIRQNAEPDARFAPGAFGTQLGKDIPVHVDGETSRTGRLVGAEIVDNGQAVLLTVEVAELPRALTEGDRGHHSIGFNAD